MTTREQEDTISTQLDRVVSFKEGTDPIVNEQNTDNQQSLSVDTIHNQQSQRISFSQDVDVKPTSKRPFTPLGDAVKTLGVLVPKMERLPLPTFFFLSFLVTIPVVLFTVAFTKMGFGATVFYYLSARYEQYAIILISSVSGLAFLLYIFDFHHWNSNTGIIMRRLFITIIVLGFFTFIIFIAGTYPYGPVSIYLLITPLWMVAAKKVFYHEVRTRTYITWLSGPLFFVGVLMFLAWLGWTLWDPANQWNPYTKLLQAYESGCEPNFEKYPACRTSQGSNNEVCFIFDETINQISFPDGCKISCTRVYEDCLNTFILWAGPLLISVGLLFQSFFCTFLRGDATPEEDAKRFANMWMFLLFSMWVSASIAGAGAGVSTTLAALTIAGFVGSGIFVGYSFKRLEREQKMLDMWNRIKNEYGKYLDLVRGLLLVTCTPVFLLYFGLSFFIQRLRSCACYNTPASDTASLRNIRGAGMMTVEARRWIREFHSWDRSKVYTYAVMWGVAFISLSVLASQFTVLFLSWLIDQTSKMNIGTVTGILSGVGMIMFLLPPVPGAPIYITIGIVIIPVGSATLGVVGAISYAVVVSLLIKLMACVLQQKMIGELLQQNLGVRQMVGINTDLIRGMKLILKQKGMAVSKVAILIGGPDWPTSVLCGILGLPILPILVGTLPILLLIIPTVLTGSFTYMKDMKTIDGQSEYPWAGTAAAICGAVSALMLFGQSLTAIYYIERTIATRKEEIDQMPIDEEVKAAEEESKVMEASYRDVTKWEILPFWTKFLQTVSLICMIVSCYMVLLFQDWCFAEYQLTYTIDEHLGGRWYNLVKPLGGVALILFTVSLFFISLFIWWAKIKAHQKYMERRGVNCSSLSYDKVDSGRDLNISSSESMSQDQVEDQTQDVESIRLDVQKDDEKEDSVPEIVTQNTDEVIESSATSNNRNLFSCDC